MPAKRAAVCPHLGLIQDHATHMSFPSVSNHCMNCRKPSRPALAHQQNYCLTLAHVDCPVYASSGNGVLPPELGGMASLGRNWILGIVLLAVAAVLAVVFLSSRSQAAAPVNTSLSPAEEALQVVETSAPPVTFTQSPLPTPTTEIIPQPSATLEPFRPDLIAEATRMAPGMDQPYLIHVVKELETLDLIAVNYNTSVQAIMAVNYKIQPPVWVDAMIVVPVGAVDAAGLPAFSVHVVDEEKISSQALADELFADTAGVELYNGCSGSCEFTQGDLLLIPRTP